MSTHSLPLLTKGEESACYTSLVIWLDKLYQRVPLPFRDGMVRGMMRLVRPQMKRHYSQFITPGDVVFDVGANLGIYTEVFLRLGARVVAVEPQPYCVAVLQRRFGGDDRVMIVQKGVGLAVGERDFYPSSLHGTGTFSRELKEESRFATRDYGKPVRIPMTTLEAIRDEFGEPAFIKIDVEGFERQVLAGLQRPVSYLSFEYSLDLFEELERCVTELSRVGAWRFNYSKAVHYAFSHHLQLGEWVDEHALLREMRKLRRQESEWVGGDIYASIL